MTISLHFSSSNECCPGISVLGGGNLMLRLLPRNTTWPPPIRVVIVIFPLLWQSLPNLPCCAGIPRRLLYLVTREVLTNIISSNCVVLVPTTCRWVGLWLLPWLAKWPNAVAVIVTGWQRNALLYCHVVQTSAGDHYFPSFDRIVVQISTGIVYRTVRNGKILHLV